MDNRPYQEPQLGPQHYKTEPVPTTLPPAPILPPIPAVIKTSTLSKPFLLPSVVIALSILLVGGAQILTTMSAARKTQVFQSEEIGVQRDAYATQDLANGYQKSIKADEYQAVFITGGQVYFGKIRKIDSAFITLTDIYYLRTQEDVQSGKTPATSSSNVSLVKLGQELHGPEDQMTIRTSSIQFWENLKADGNVSKAIANFKKNT